MKETDLFIPLHTLFTQAGYQVNAEVASFDVVLSKQDELIIIECKLSFNMTLLYQAMNAQKVADFLYVAVPYPAEKKVYNMTQVAKNMGLGLVLVTPNGRAMIAVTQEDVLAYHAHRNNVKAQRVKKEISGRRFDKNIGGSTKTKILTAYKETSVQIAVMLEDKPQGMSGKQLVSDYGCPANTTKLMHSNTMGWFERPSKGVYRLSQKGRKELTLPIYKEAVNFWREHKKLDKSMIFE